MKKFVLFFVIFLKFINAFSQDEPRRDTIIDIFELTLEELAKVEVITATKKSQNLSEAPSIISSLSKNELKKNGRNNVN